MTQLVELIEKVRGMVNMSDKKDIAWVTVLSKHGKVKELIHMEASLRVLLSSQADGLIRAIEIMEKFMDQNSGMAETLKAESKDITLDKEQVKEFMLRYVQVQGVDSEQLARAGFDKAQEVKHLFMEHLKKMLHLLVSNMDTAKLGVNSWSKYEPAVEATTKWNDAVLDAILKNDSVKDVKKLAQGGLAFFSW